VLSGCDGRAGAASARPETSSSSPSPVSTTASSGASTAPATWRPLGYEAWDADPELAWTWTPNEELVCPGETRCWGVTVVSKRACATVTGTLAVVKTVQPISSTSIDARLVNVAPQRPYDMVFSARSGQLDERVTYLADLNVLTCA